jgi:ABC-type lipoprotein export system ATPase subunit
VRYLQEFNRDGGTVVMVTHGTNADLAANRVVQLEKGQIISQ